MRNSKSLSTTSRPRSIPTEKQARQLRILASGAVAIVPGRRDWTPLLRRGWVQADEEDEGKRYLPPVRITPEGLKAYAEAAAFDGLPAPDWGNNGHERPRQVNEAPEITELKRERDKARQEAREARLKLCRAEAVISRIRREVGEPSSQ